MYVIWSFFNLKNFFENIPVKNYIFIEAEDKFMIDSIRATLIENNIESIQNPNENDIKDFIFRKEVPIILFKRRSTIGTIRINDIITPIIERTIVDLYFLITRIKLPFPIEELGKILEKSIKTGVFNFTFVDKYIRWRNLEYDFLMTFSILEQKYPNIVPNRYRKKFDAINSNVKSLLGEFQV